MTIDVMFEVIGAHIDGDIDRLTMFGFAITLLEIDALDETPGQRP